MRVLVACEFSGVVRDAFSNKGHFAVSCDLLPSETEGWHYKGDVLKLLSMRWDMMIAHPPCTYLARSGARWWSGREDAQNNALAFVKALLDAPIDRIALENPPGRIGTAIRPADQYVQPWQFGHNETKLTGLWLKGLPLLVATDVQNERRANLTPTGQNNLGPSPDRWKMRSRTYRGIAEAMASQWGGLS